MKHSILAVAVVVLVGSWGSPAVAQPGDWAPPPTGFDKPNAVSFEFGLGNPTGGVGIAAEHMFNRNFGAVGGAGFALVGGHLQLVLGLRARKRIASRNSKPGRAEALGIDGLLSFGDDQQTSFQLCFTGGCGGGGKGHVITRSLWMNVIAHAEVRWIQGWLTRLQVGVSHRVAYGECRRSSGATDCEPKATTYPLVGLAFGRAF